MNLSTALARLTDGGQRAHALGLALEAARALSPSWRADALLHVAAELESPERDRVIEEALLTADPWHVRIAAELAPSLVSDAVVQRALEQALVQGLGSGSEGPIELLASNLASRPKVHLYQAGIAHRDRDRPATERVYGPSGHSRAADGFDCGRQAASDFAQTILRTIQWWP